MAQTLATCGDFGGPEERIPSLTSGRGSARGRKSERRGRGGKAIAERFGTGSRMKAWNQQKVRYDEEPFRLEVGTETKRLYKVEGEIGGYGKGEELTEAEGFHNICCIDSERDVCQGISTTSRMNERKQLDVFDVE